MKLIQQLFSRRSLWTVALYRLQSPGDIFNAAERVPERFFGENGLRLSPGYHSTTADPFLFSHAGRLYLFVEVQTDFGKGEIWAQSVGADGVWEDHGLVLIEDFHLSYPNVFADSSGRMYMLPETAASGKVWLYTTDEFPYRWRRVAALFDSPLIDPSILFTDDGLLLLGTTRSGEFKVHALPSLDGLANPQGLMVTNDRAVSRGGGAPFVVDGKHFRPAQNCKNFYGENLSIMEIETLGSDEYRERLYTADLYPRRPKWMALGYHHMSIAKFGDDYFLAIDGRGKDKYLNTILLAFFKLLDRFPVGGLGRRLSPAT